MRHYSNEEIETALAQLEDLYGLDSPELLEFTSYITGGNDASELDTTHEPVSIEQFITDPYFMGGIFETVWPAVKESIKDVINGGFNEALFTGAIGVGKTTRATIIAAYNLYVLSCYRDPQAKLGLMPRSEIVIAMLNKTETLARDVTYKKFRRLIEQIPYFSENFPFDASVEKKMLFPNDIVVIYAAATNDKLMGMDIVSGIVDEINFFARVEKSKRSALGGLYDQAMEIYNGIVRRIKSRFLGVDGLNGCLSVVSSRSHVGDFTDRRMKEVAEELARGEENKTYIDDKPQWEMLPPLRPDGKVRFSGKTFMVAIGSERLNSAIIEHTTEAQDREILHVPIEFYSDFLKDIEGSLRDFAGRVSRSKNAYFYNMEQVWLATDPFDQQQYQTIFTVDQWELSRGMPPLNEAFKLYNPHCFRAAHIDLGLNKDGCGIAIGHSPGEMSVRIRDGDNYIIEEAPIIHYDLLLSVIPLPGEEVEFADVRQLLYYVRDTLKIPLKWVSFDGFQSVDSRQILRRKGFKSSHVSVEGEESYQALRTAFYQERVIAQPHKLCFTEISQLEQDPDTRKIDHPPTGSKDVSDGMAGAFVSLSNKRPATLRMNVTKVIDDESGEEIEVVTHRRKVERRKTERR